MSVLFDPENRQWLELRVRDRGPYQFRKAWCYPLTLEEALAKMDGKTYCASECRVELVRLGLRPRTDP